MSFLSVNNLRNRRVSNQNNIFGPTQMSISNLHTDSRQTQSMHTIIEDLFTACDKNDMKMSFGDELFINSLHLIPDPLKKNLADSLITEELPKSTPKMENLYDKVNINHQAEHNTTLSGITNFFSGVFNILTSAMFKKPQSPVDFYDCVDSESHEMAPEAWQQARGQEKDINVLAVQSFNCNKTNLDKLPKSDVKTDTSIMADCKTAAVHCEDKLKRVKELLSTNKVARTSVQRCRRPKKVFVEAGSVEDSFEDAFSPEDFVSDPNDTYTEYFTPIQYHINDFCEIQSPLLMTEGKPLTSTDIATNTFNFSDENSLGCPNPSVELALKDTTQTSSNMGVNREVVTSCEDKLAKLKAMLQDKRKKTQQEPEIKTSESAPINIKDNKFKNPNRSTCKRKNSRMKRNIDEDMLFANEIALDDSSVDNSPVMVADRCPFTKDSIKNDSDFFDEVRGRFRSDSTTDSEDSFQIVVADCPGRLRRPSVCDSEDSFIVFEETADSCYTSNEVFDSDTDEESGLSDSGCMTTLSHALTKSVTNLTEECLYEDQCIDEVDCVFESDSGLKEGDGKNTGVLLDAKKKLLKKCLPVKKVSFSTQPPEVRVMRVWAFAARQARIGDWERYSRDRDRFKRRIADVDMAVSWVLKPQHRSRVVFQRFMPWWNAEKRRELADKKLREEQEKEEATGTEVSGLTDGVAAYEANGPTAADSMVVDGFRVTDKVELAEGIKLHVNGILQAGENVNVPTKDENTFKGGNTFTDGNTAREVVEKKIENVNCNNIEKGQVTNDVTEVTSKKLDAVKTEESGKVSRNINLGVTNV